MSGATRKVCGQLLGRPTQYAVLQSLQQSLQPNKALASLRKNPFFPFPVCTLAFDDEGGCGAMLGVSGQGNRSMWTRARVAVTSAFCGVPAPRNTIGASTCTCTCAADCCGREAAALAAAATAGSRWRAASAAEFCSGVGAGGVWTVGVVGAVGLTSPLRAGVGGVCVENGEGAGGAVSAV